MLVVVYFLKIILSWLLACSVVISNIVTRCTDLEGFVGTERFHMVRSSAAMQGLQRSGVRVRGGRRVGQRRKA